MGHTRLGELPTGRKWKKIVEALTSQGGEGVTYGILSGDVEDVAIKTLDAAQAGLASALRDEGLQFTFYLLTQLTLASREQDWRDRLSQVGINASDVETPFGLTAEVQNAIDDYLTTHGKPTDISEMAQQAAGEALTSLTAHKVSTLFGTGETELRSAVRTLSTKKGFADLGQKFFGLFMARFLNFYLSRATAAHVGGNKIRNIADVSTFNEILTNHCQQTARIVRDYCGQWYSSTEYKEGIDLENTSRFMAVALRKLQSELKQQRQKL